jgi:hypothetical protein
MAFRDFCFVSHIKLRVVAFDGLSLSLQPNQKNIRIFAPPRANSQNNRKREDHLCFHLPESRKTDSLGASEKQRYPRVIQTGFPTP